MPAINLFFTQNRPLIYFVGGLSFFAMGFASALQRRRYSNLRLARSLGLLSWFGILYAFNEWGSLFVPLQEALPVPATASWLTVAQLAARGLALALLFQFGIELLRASSRAWRPLRLLPGLLLGAWLLAVLYLGVVMHAPGEIVLSTGDILARYLLGLPAAALSCLGLLEQRHEVREAGFGSSARYLLGAAVSLGFFGVVGGLLAVAGPFFPGEWLAYPAILYTVGVFVPILRTLDGLAMAIFTGRALSVFESEAERTIAEIQRRNLLLVERERISRELHDGIIQALYATGLRLEDAYHTLEESPTAAGQKISGVMSSLNQVIAQIRDYIFELQRGDEEGSLVQRLGDLVREVRLNTMLEATLRVHGDRCELSREAISHLWQVTQEALSNTVRHAEARHVQVELFCSPTALRLQVEDDGRGFDPEEVRAARQGLGLRTMGERVALLGGVLSVESRPGAGTRVAVEVPCHCPALAPTKEE